MDVEPGAGEIPTHFFSIGNSLRPTLANWAGPVSGDVGQQRTFRALSHVVTRGYYAVCMRVGSCLIQTCPL